VFVSRGAFVTAPAQDFWTGLPAKSSRDGERSSVVAVNSGRSRCAPSLRLAEERASRYLFPSLRFEGPAGCSFDWPISGGRPEIVFRAYVDQAGIKPAGPDREGGRAAGQSGTFPSKLLIVATAMQSRRFSGKRPMRYAASPHLRPAPPLRVAAPSHAFIDETSDDVRRLAADIDLVLSRPPQSLSLSRRLGAVRPLAPVDRSGAATEALADEGDTVLDFEWQAEPLQSKPPPRADAARAASWLSKAKRERRSSRVRAAFSWLVALSLGGGIIALSALVILGDLPSMTEVVAMVRSYAL
jgi:hypothetical protein